MNKQVQRWAALRVVQMAQLCQGFSSFGLIILFLYSVVFASYLQDGCPRSRPHILMQSCSKARGKVLCFSSSFEERKCFQNCQ